MKKCVVVDGYVTPSSVISHRYVYIKFAWSSLDFSGQFNQKARFSSWILANLSLFSKYACKLSLRHLALTLTAVSGQFQQIGPPRNVSVTLTEDGYLVTWQPPEFGSDEIRTYRVRWTQPSREYIYGSAETQDTFFLGDLFFWYSQYLFILNKIRRSEA